MNPQRISDIAFEPTINALRQLSPSSRDVVIATVTQLARREGIDVSLNSCQVSSLRSTECNYTRFWGIKKI